VSFDEKKSSLGLFDQETEDQRIARECSEDERADRIWAEMRDENEKRERENTARRGPK
jgi:hypothetical protein